MRLLYVKAIYPLDYIWHLLIEMKSVGFTRLRENDTALLLYWNLKWIFGLGGLINLSRTLDKVCPLSGLFVYWYYCVAVHACIHTYSDANTFLATPTSISSLTRLWAHSSCHSLHHCIKSCLQSTPVIHKDMHTYTTFRKYLELTMSKDNKRFALG